MHLVNLLQIFGKTALLLWVSVFLYRPWWGQWLERISWLIWVMKILVFSLTKQHSALKETMSDVLARYGSSSSAGQKKRSQGLYGGETAGSKKLSSPVQACSILLATVMLGAARNLCCALKLPWSFSTGELWARKTCNPKPGSKDSHLVSLLENVCGLNERAAFLSTHKPKACILGYWRRLTSHILHLKFGKMLLITQKVESWLLRCLFYCMIFLFKETNLFYITFINFLAERKHEGLLFSLVKWQFGAKLVLTMWSRRLSYCWWCKVNVCVPVQRSWIGGGGGQHNRHR